MHNLASEERVCGGGGGLLIIAFSSWPRLLVLNMCIVRLYLKTCSNHQTVFIFTFVSMKFSDNSTGAFNRKLTCWGHQIGASSSALICISSFTGIILLRKYLSALFLSFPCMIPYFVRPARRTRGFPQYPKFSYPPNIQVLKNFKPHKITPSPEISSSYERARIRSNNVFLFHEYWNILLLHHRVYTAPWLQKSVLKIHLGWNNRCEWEFQELTGTRKKTSITGPRDSYTVTCKDKGHSGSLAQNRCFLNIYANCWPITTKLLLIYNL